MKNVLVYIDDEAVNDSIDLLEIARRMYGADGFLAYALTVCSRPGDARHAFDYIIRTRDGSLSGFDPAGVAACIEELHNRYRFDAVLFPATVFGRMIAPRAAVRLRAGLVADVTDLGYDGEEVFMVRPAFSGRMLAQVVCRGTGPVMMSVRPRTFSYSVQMPKPGRVIFLDPPVLENSGIRLLETREKTEVQDIRDCEVLISGGGGALRIFPLMERLAELLHGMVSASRKAVDDGLAPRSRQVGQSGKYVSPRLYIALGISGSAQHVAGIKNAELIISVNVNPHAPICSLSDIVVEGDAREFLEALIKRIEEVGSTPKGGTE